MNQCIYSRTSSICGGGGSRKERSKSMIDSFQEADQMIQIKRTPDYRGVTFNVLKDRYGGYTGQYNIEESIDLISRILCEMKLGSNKLFQESLHLKISETLKEILLTTDNCIPTSNAIKKYLEGNDNDII